jgi:tRNA pseudouridine55 synthase
MDGLLVIDKPVGLTSHDVVARVRRSLRTKRVGHTGTLDPFATGVLVVLVGRATRLAQFMSGAEKEYEAVVRFGYETETGDCTGARREEPAGSLSSKAQAARLPTGDEIEAALRVLRGWIEQVPPMYSAKKIRGEKLYELARRGEVVERQPARVHIRVLEPLEMDGALIRSNEDGTRELMVRVACSAGTYIRVLAEEIGRRLGLPAHLSALRRTRAGSFTIERAVTLGQLEERARDWSSLLIPAEAALPELPVLHLTAEDARRARHGMGVRVSQAAAAAWQEAERVRMVSEADGLIAVGVYEARTELLQPRVVLVGAE